jgi:lysophospholipase L1-like esterase
VIGRIILQHVALNTREAFTLHWRRLLRLGGKLLLSVIFFCVVLEVAVRIVAPVDRLVMTPNMYDPVLGTRMEPNFTGFIHCPEYQIKLAINAKGLRDREHPYEKPAGVRRILCLGDSFTAGFGVDAEETFPKVAERLLAANATATLHWEVINAGVGGTGTAHHLAYFETEGFKYEPDLTVLAFCVNDFWDNMIAGLYSQEEGRLVRHEAPADWQLKVRRWTRWIPGYANLFSRSHALNVLKHLIAETHYRGLGRQVRTECDRQAERQRQTTFAATLIVALDESCRQHGGRFLLMIVPPVLDQTEDAERLSDLAKTVSAKGVQCLDLRPRFEEFKRQGIEINYPDDGHWNVTGHEMVGEILWRFVRDDMR